MCLPQVINAMASLPRYLNASFNTLRPSVSFILFIASGGELIVLNSVDVAVTENLNLPFDHFPHNCIVYVSIM